MSSGKGVRQETEREASLEALHTRACSRSQRQMAGLCLNLRISACGLVIQRRVEWGGV